MFPPVRAVFASFMSHDEQFSVGWFFKRKSQTCIFSGMECRLCDATASYRLINVDEIVIIVRLNVLTNQNETKSNQNRPNNMIHLHSKTQTHNLHHTLEMFFIYICDWRHGVHFFKTCFLVNQIETLKYQMAPWLNGLVFASHLIIHTKMIQMFCRRVNRHRKWKEIWFECHVLPRA